MILNETYTLNNDVEIPKLGLGTWFTNGDEAVEVVKEALETGYRHIDSAQAYQNEKEMGGRDQNQWCQERRGFFNHETRGRDQVI